MISDIESLISDEGPPTKPAEIWEQRMWGSWVCRYTYEAIVTEGEKEKQQSGRPTSPTRQPATINRKRTREDFLASPPPEMRSAASKGKKNVQLKRAAKRKSKRERN